MIELSSSSEDIRRVARELVWSHGKAATTIAEWKAVELNDVGRFEEAKRWLIISATILAMTED